MVATPVPAAEPLITIVIPVLNDRVALASLLEALPADPSVEIIVVNGSELRDPAMDALSERYPGLSWMQSAPGRGVQMNRGARHARGRWLVFLHADTRLGLGGSTCSDVSTNSRKSSAAAFASRWIRRHAGRGGLNGASGSALACLISAYGDQALFVGGPFSGSSEDTRSCR